jgi:sec-independent protein translocase protein TatA
LPFLAELVPALPIRASCPLSPLAPLLSHLSCESDPMFGIGHWELLAVLVVIFILFGHRLPSVMRSLGTGITEFKKGMNTTVDDDEVAVEKKKEA